MNISKIINEKEIIKIISQATRDTLDAIREIIERCPDIPKDSKKKVLSELRNTRKKALARTDT